jgi:hypothetical protein
MLMNNTNLTNTKLGVNPCAHEQHAPNLQNWGWTHVLMNNTDLTKTKLAGNPDAREQHEPNQKTTGGEPRGSWTTRT